MKILFVILIAFCRLSWADSSDIKGVTIGHIKHPNISAYKKFIAKTYSDIGISTKFNAMPITRRLIMANEGLVDGIIAAIPSTNKTFSNLIQVGPPITRSQVWLVCQKAILCSKSVLEDTEKTIYTSKGSLRVLNKELGLTVNSKIYKIDDYVQLKAMLAKGRIKYLIFGISQRKLIQKFEQQFQLVELGTFSLYHHIHKSNVGIKKELEKSLSANLHMVEHFIN